MCASNLFVTIILLDRWSGILALDFRIRQSNILILPCLHHLATSLISLQSLLRSPILEIEP